MPRFPKKPYFFSLKHHDMKSTSFATILLFAAGALFAQKPVFNIIDFGAVPNGVTLATKAIQWAVDSASRLGGGTVLIPPGQFLSGSFYLKSNVTLHLAKNGILKGSTSRMDYEKIVWHALVLAKGQENIAITGQGTIDGQGAALAADVVRLVKDSIIIDIYWGNNRPHERERPQLIEFNTCKNVLIKGVTLRNSACWVQSIDRCDGVRIDSIRVNSMAYWNNDGIDIIDSRNVHISNCDINTADDGICLKSSFPPNFCENILIENCRVRSSASALKFGTATRSGFKNVTVRNLEVYDTYRSAVAIEIVDGGFLENIDIGHINARNTGNAVFVRLGHRNTKTEPGTLRNVRIHDITVEVPEHRPDEGYDFPGPEVTEPHNLIPSSITGIPGHPVQDVTLENINIIFGGGGKKSNAEVPLTALDKVPERPANYPEFSMFDELPAWGFYVRHAEGITFKNITLTLKEYDFRPVFVFDDVKNLTLYNITAPEPAKGPSVVFNNVHKAHMKKMFIGKKGATNVLSLGDCTGIKTSKN